MVNVNLKGKINKVGARSAGNIVVSANAMGAGIGAGLGAKFD